ncbi:MAG: PD40 domain-containing protein, partial [Caldilineaceae bacterium]|nr:PD40 domain-containing protein [Caldilineaceae bacterium]
MESLRRAARQLILGGVLLLVSVSLVWTLAPLVPTVALDQPGALLRPSQQSAPNAACAICRSKERWWEWQATVMPIQGTSPATVNAASNGEMIRDWMRIAYQSASFLGADWQIYYHNFAGDSTIIPLTAGSSNTQPRLSPDTQQIVFVSNRDTGANGRGRNIEIYRMNNDGSAQTRLTFADAPDTMPAWSADGQQIVLVSERDGNPELYLMQADGSNPRRLTSDSQPDVYPSWSPDGRTLAWVRANGETGDLLLMNVDGSNPRTF